MTQIDYYFSLMSPFTYLAGLRLEEIAARHGATIRYRAADIRKVLSETGGVAVPQRHPSRQAYRLQELRRISARAGLPLTIAPAHWPVDQAPASIAVIRVAEAGGPVATVVHALLRAVWAEERDIADPGTIAAILEAEGADPALATPTPDARAAYDANTDAAIADGVFGAPFYIVGGEKFWGQDRLDYLDDHLATLG